MTPPGPGRPVRVDTPDGRCYKGAPFGRFGRLNAHFVHMDRLAESMGRR
jgi:hypothetical protein